ncbi:MAG: signal recognition particle-docking protein FtsY [Nanoarchaeota archaeon]
MFDLLKKKIAGWLSSEKTIDSSPDKPLVKEVFDKPVAKRVVSSSKKSSSKVSKTSKNSKSSTVDSAAVVDDFDSVDLDKPQSSSDNSAKSEPVMPHVEPKKGFFSKIKSVFSNLTITEEFFVDSFNDLELILLEGNVAVSVVDFIKERMSSKLVGREFKKDEVKGKVTSALRETIDELLIKPSFDVIDYIKKSPTTVTILFCGINGSGKTTTLAKFAKLLKNNNISCVFAAADTFRAASIEQLAIHGERLGVHVIKQTYGSDPAAVAYDAIQYAKAKKIKVVLVDTAGRMHTKQNLMDEMGKIVRVAKPDFKFFVGESITGNDATEQARIFNDSVNIDGIILTKSDIDEKGGTAISVSKVTGKPIVFLGNGQSYDDLVPFDKDKILAALGL